MDIISVFTHGYYSSHSNSLHTLAGVQHSVRGGSSRQIGRGCDTSALFSDRGASAQRKGNCSTIVLGRVTGSAGCDTSAQWSVQGAGEGASVPLTTSPVLGRLAGARGHERVKQSDRGRYETTSRQNGRECT